MANAEVKFQAGDRVVRLPITPVVPTNSFDLFAEVGKVYTVHTCYPEYMYFDDSWRFTRPWYFRLATAHEILTLC